MAVRLSRFAMRASLRRSFRSVSVAAFRPPTTIANNSRQTPGSAVAYEQVRFHKMFAHPPSPRESMTLKEVEERLLKSIKAFDRFPREKEDQLTMETDFQKDLGLDSLDHVEIVMAVEDEFDLEIPDGDAEAMKTVKHVYNYIVEKRDVYE